MFIKLTNASPAHKGKVVGINGNAIVSMHTDKIGRPNEDETITTMEDVTFLFCPPHGTWEVTETIDEVVNLLNGKTTKGWLK